MTRPILGDSRGSIISKEEWKGYNQEAMQMEADWLIHSRVGASIPTHQLESPEFLSEMLQRLQGWSVTC